MDDQSGFHKSCKPTMLSWLSSLWKKIACYGRMIIPTSRKKIILMAELHNECMGVSKMKPLSMSHVWWASLEAFVKSSSSCAAVKEVPSQGTMHALCTHRIGQFDRGSE